MRRWLVLLIVVGFCACGSESREAETPLAAEPDRSVEVETPEEPEPVVEPEPASSAECERALAEELERVAELGRDVENPPVFDRAGFLGRCNAASPSEQRCMSHRYAVEHEECVVERGTS